MKMPWSRSQQHIDEKVLAEKAQAKADLATYIECGDEEGYVQLIKKLRPQIKPEELVALIDRFRMERRKLSRGL